MSTLTFMPDSNTQFIATAAALGLTPHEGEYYTAPDRVLSPAEIVRLRGLLQRSLYSLVHAEVRGRA